MNKQDFLVINAKGLFSNHLTSEMVITTHAVQLIEKSLMEQQTSKNDAKVKEFLALVKKLPIEKKHFQAQKNDGVWPNGYEPALHLTRANIYGNMHTDAYCFFSPGNFVTASNSYAWASVANPTHDVTKWGVHEALALQKLIPAVQDYAASVGLSITLSKSPAPAKIVKRFDSGEWRIQIKNPALDLGQVDACVLYVPHPQSPGYLDARGNLSPLAGARLFESAGSAARTKSSRGLTDAIIVHVRASLTKIDPDQNIATNANVAPLQEAIALIEKQELEKALEGASVEQLKKRLGELEQKYGEVQGDQNRPSTKKRM